jgi:hypothetical protein
MINVQIGGGLQPTNAPVENLGKDLANLFGAVSKGVETYNEIGATAAKLEFSEMYRNTLAKHDALKQESMKLRDDDVEGHEWIANKATQLQEEFPKKLSMFSDHKAAYDVFADASAGALHQLQGYNSDFFESAKKASKTRAYNMADTSLSIGLKTTKEIFDTNKDSLNIVAENDQQSIDDTRKILFSHAWSNISDNANSVSKFDAVTELMDKSVGGVTFTSHERVAEFMNRRILQGSETAKMKVVTSKDGVKTFAVDGFFGDEQNSKIIQLADQYISMMQKPDGDKDYWIGLKELKTTVANIRNDNLAQMEAGTSAVAWGRVGELAKQYLATPEGKALKSDPNKEFEFNEMLGEVSKAGARKDAMLRIAENPNALLKLKAGDGEVYSYITPKGFKAGVTQCSQEAYKSGQCDKLALKQSDLSAITNYLQAKVNMAKNSDPIAANRLEKVLSIVTDSKSPAKSVATNILMGKATFRTKKEAENQLTILDSNQAELTASEYNAAREILGEVIKTFDSDGNITPDTLRSLTGSAKTKKIDNIDNAKKIEINKAVNNVAIFGDNKVSTRVTDFLYDKLLREGKFDPRLDSSESIAGLIKSNTVVVDFDGQTNTRIPMLGGLTEKAATNGIHNFLKRMGKENKYGIKFDSDNVRIYPSEDGLGYVVNWKNAKNKWQERGQKLTPEMVWEYSLSKKWN